MSVSVLKRTLYWLATASLSALLAPSALADIIAPAVVGSAVPADNTIWPLPSAPVETPRDHLQEPAPALPPSVLTDQFGMRVIAWSGSLTSGGQVGNSSGDTGTVFSGEDDLGLKSKKWLFPALELSFRLGDRQRILLEYLDSDRVSTVTLNHDISYLNKVFHSGDRLQGELNWRVFSGSFLLDILHGKRYAASFLAGIQVEQALSAMQLDALSSRSSVSATGVMPVVGIEGTWLMGDNSRWSIIARGKYFNTQRVYFVYKPSQFGATRDLHLDVQYRFADNLSAGVGYTNFRASSQVETNVAIPGADHLKSTGQLQFAVAGPEAFFRVSF
jgi:hypothetical protein